MDDVLTVLETAISDIGNWRWWDQSLPSKFVVEFGGVKLWTPPTRIDQPPRSIFGLGFKDPTLIAFVSDTAAAGLRCDWRFALHSDQIEPFGMFDDVFTLRSDAQFPSILEGCDVEYLVGSESDLFSTSPVRLGFRAGPVGLIVRANQMAVAPFTGADWAAQIAAASAGWAPYWNEYWSRRDTDSPMPEDFRCEIEIPFDRYQFHGA